MTTVAELSSIHSDLYKDVHGFRPRFINYSTITEKQLLDMISDLEVEMKLVMEEEDRIQNENINKLETRITDIINTGAKDRETAIRWLHEAEYTNGDNDYLCFVLNIPYGYFN